jgi:hypothetical protein
MKKLLVLVLSVMFVAGAFTSAYATHGEVLGKVEGTKIILGGDARLRGLCKINHDTNDDVDDDNCYWDQRVRLTVTGQVGDAEVRTRLTTGDKGWNDATNTDDDIAVDYAYLHIPVAGVVIDAGRQKATFGNKFYIDDVGKDRFQISAKVGDATVGAYSDKRSEAHGPEGFLNNDVDDYGLFAVYKAGDLEGGALVVFRNDDQVDDNDGTDATAYVNTKVGNVGVKGEVSLKTGDHNYVTTDEDTQWGGFVSADMGMDALTVGGLLGFTANGFVADKHFTPTVLIGTTNPWAMEDFGARGDSIIGVLSAKYQATPELSVGGNVAYASYETYPDNGTDSSSVEVDAGVRYQIAKGVTYDVNLGYLIPSDYSAADDNVLSISNQFTVNFN